MLQLHFQCSVKSRCVLGRFACRIDSLLLVHHWCVKICASQMEISIIDEPTLNRVCLLADGEAAAKERLGLGVTALCSVELGQAGEAISDIAVVRTKRL